LVWPTNLGWMMGPWLVFASLVNRAAIGLFYGAPTGAEFGLFVQDAKATMLGVVPSYHRNRHSAVRARDFQHGCAGVGFRNP
jgi:acetyl-CoA synthetase